MREEIELRCILTTTPGTSFLTHSVSADYHGVVEEIPYRRAYENEIGMTFIVDNNYDTVSFFEKFDVAPIVYLPNFSVGQKSFKDQVEIADLDELYEFILIEEE